MAVEHRIQIDAVPSERLEHGRLLAVLDVASQVDGPVRLFVPRSGVDEPGLVDRRDEAQAELVDQLVGSLLEETPRASNQPRRVVLTEGGLRFLVRHRPAGERPDIVKRASPLYQDRLLRVWKTMATPAEAELLKRCAADLYGDLLEASQRDDGAFDLAKAKELVLSWNRADDPDVKAGLARAMIAVGLRPVGEVGDKVAFSGRLHVSEESLFSGDPAEIVAPGWAVEQGAGERILQKAKVKFSE